MYRSRNVKCADCKDIFRIEYDSRKSKQDIYKCKCGKLVCYPDSYGSFSYNRDGNYEKLNYEEEERKFIQYEEDYIRLSETASLLLSEINTIGEQLGRNSGIYFYNSSDKDEISLELSGGNELESISIKANVKLKDDQGWKIPEEKQRKEDRIIESLTSFKNVLEKVKNGELDLSKPQKVWEDNSLEWHDGTRTQQKLYDYELLC